MIDPPLVAPTPPIVQLIQAQIDWIEDHSLFKIYDKARQIGITWAEVLDIVMQLAGCPGTPWFYLTLNEQRAAEAIGYAVAHCLAQGVHLTAKNLDVGFFEKTKYRQLTLTLPNGSKLVGLPANPTTARGVHGNVTLDEFGHQIHARKIFTAIAPAATTWGYHLRIISTPNGRQGEYHSIWTANGKMEPEAIELELRAGRQPIADDWSRHLCDIFTAKTQGHPVDIERCRRIARTEMTFAQEYCCKFLDTELSWMPFELLEKCTRGEASVIFDSTQPPAGPLYAGYDIGRNRNLASLWLNELRGEDHVARGVITMDNKPFRTQKRIVDDNMRFIHRLGVDGIGIGAQLAEDLQADWGESTVYPVPGADRAKVATKVRTLAERGHLWLPDCPEVRADFASVQRTLTAKGNASFQAPNRADGHADRFWSCGFAIEASEDAPEYSHETVDSSSRHESDRIGSRGWRDHGY